MNKVLAEYISICSQFRKDGLSKPERKQRHAMLSEWPIQQYILLRIEA